MPDIRYVCLSDMHLGADSSVLTAIKPNGIEIDQLTTSPVLSQLVACLKELIGHNERAAKPILVLNGDILELGLTDTNKAAMVFERFMDLVFPPDGEALFDKTIIYNPGNHDHHIWESARDTQYIHYISGIPAGQELPVPWHTTKMFAPDFVPEYLLTNLLRRHPHLQDVVVNVVYPNYALVSDDGQKCVIFSHGHYVESIYSLMSTLNTMLFPDRTRPKVTWDLEAENFAWLDFLWSTLGRSGDVGLDIGLLYAKLQSKLQFERLLDNFVTGLIATRNQPKLIKGVEVGGLKLLLDVILGRSFALERNRTAHPLSPDALQGLHTYLEGPLHEQVLIENKQKTPTDITFLFGHTHKPFQQSMDFAGYPAPIRVYNSGGWVVDRVQQFPIYGARVLLVDEKLQTVSLNMYDQSPNKEDYAVRVEVTSQGSNSFYDRIRTFVNPSNDPWKTFSVLVADAVLLHAQVLQAKIDL